MSESVAARFKAALFDMDGVITDTAGAHAEAWQRLFDGYLEARATRRGEEFRPFDPAEDYLRYVDGKPREAGVRSFLASRGIELPEGGPEDAPDAETIHALARLKNGYFNDWLAANAARAYPGTLALLRALRDAGVRLAVFSASRNAAAVLQSAGVLEAFDLKVDGADLARLGLPGKPDPAMLLEAARGLGMAPGDCVVFEDAIAGIKAAARGGFGLVVGVDRGGQPDALAAAGAQLVVEDLAELELESQGAAAREAPGTATLRLKTLANRPSPWTHAEALRRRLDAANPAVFLDYDGTLTPIVTDFRRALLAAEMRAAIAALGRRCPVTIVSGRDLARLRELVQLDEVYLAGSHGFEIAGPEGSGLSLEKGGEFLPSLEAAEGALEAHIEDIPGASVERKRFSIAVHYREVADERVGEVRAAVDTVLAEQARLVLGHGKKVYELRPALPWDKGAAVLWLLAELGLDEAGTLPVYIGDDITDEDAFRALAGRGLCIGVRHGETRRTAADFALEDTDEVRHFLEQLAAALGPAGGQGGGKV